MLRIGEFSKLSRISIQMLRHYDEIGLLRPVHVEASSGYRYYSETQLPVCNVIGSMRAMGMGLEAIGQILQSDPGQTPLTLLRQHLERQEAERVRLEEQIGRIKQLIGDLEREREPMTVVVKEIPLLRVMSCRGYLETYAQEGLLWGKVHAAIASQGLKLHAPAYQIAVFHDKSFMESHIDVEVQCAVSGPGRSDGQVESKTRPPVTVASHTFQGSYARLSAVNAGIAQWIMQSGYALDGAGFNIYHISPQDQTDAEHMVTEVCFPVKRVRAG